MDEADRRPPAFECESEAYALFRRGLAFLRDGHPAQARMLLAQALRLEPGRNSLREALGRAEFALGRYTAAGELFATIAAEVPDNDYAHYALARCLLRQRRDDEARAHLRLARALRPEEPRYREALDALD